ncbi:AraC family transcriptional regulator [Thalassotalea eurytherma]|uniref:HTH araC/xylS-type domain-containing protein n=1 Tax=Thalassotalea eurytherma TaxID=1144278 RepID=A0ABQ6H6Y4_9GAMM|nr:AraC family transcriptional regulator [Thalassotalea eurytherma]GLX83259.1 hypothetical protein theurythT_27110 [Thalassotalea eurytherma]
MQRFKTVSKVVAIQKHLSLLNYLKQRLTTSEFNTVNASLIDIRTLPEQRVGFYVIEQNIETVLGVINEPLLGIEVVDGIDFESLPGISLLLANFKLAKSKEQLGELIILFAEYFPLLTQAVDITLKWDVDAIQIYANAIDHSISTIQVEGALYGVFKILKMLVNLSPVSISFTHSPSTIKESYQSFFNAPVTFNATKNCITYKATPKYFNLENRSLTVVSGINELMKSEFPNLSTTIQCSVILKSILHFGEPSRAHVASIMNLSISTLQRRLRKENTCFKDILQNIRKEISLILLIEHDLTLSNIAFLLGYHSESQLSRAFKCWYGEAPSIYKKTCMQ